MSKSEKVYVEIDWYDGPRAGVADVKGVPHRFVADFDDSKGYLDSFRLFPISKSDLELEIEQWTIYVRWSRLCKSGAAQASSHPGGGGVNPRWDELDLLLRESREVPETCLSAHATFELIEGRCSRYEESGPDYRVTWHFIE
ncbi:hypothetical protein O5O45_08830 [Hahella aquimaris]|uniref:hypothetical protein n=1 Tax=Hahella sp. HNIBRBA332 TaxID=3015983 RepID=UPI00273AEBEF|nr:hypothetical protein [Hahella sp. HNIBRBA332]WLQ16017.1 hypothetical protein O5O45_08830 [Hahella sp. HNIBRBA332]